MKKYLIALVCVIGAGLSFNSYAQETKSADKTPKACVEKCEGPTSCEKWKEGKRKGCHKHCDQKKDMLKGIELTADQKVKAEKAHTSFKERVAKLKERIRQEREKAVSEYDADMKKILTPEQYAQFEKNRADKCDKACKDGQKKFDKKGDRKDGKKGNKKHGFKNQDRSKKGFRVSEAASENAQ